MITDLHCHYPMHLLAQDSADPTLEHMVHVRRRRPGVGKLQAAVLALAARILDYRSYSDTWRVSLEGLEAGDVGVVLSVLYRPFAEMDFSDKPGSAPKDAYYDKLVQQLDDVERELRRLDPQGSRHLIVRGSEDLEQALAGEQIAFIHCIEGGFHLGATPEHVERNVERLAGRGVTYVTLAHLFWRQVATNAPALPFLPDRLYNLIFHQPPREGLTELGRAAVRAMYRQRMLVDLSHMRQDAINETLELLGGLDSEHGADPRDFPVIASHSGFRFGHQAYNLDRDTIGRIAERDGVVGLLLAQHQLNDGIRRQTDTLDQSMDVICRHIDAIHDITGSYDNVGIGSDLDGFIKPTMAGLDRAEDLAKLSAPLERRYPGQAERILSTNGLRVLRKSLAGRTAGPEPGGGAPQ